MSKRHRVQLHRQAGYVALQDGATFGSNLYAPNGQLLTVAMLAQAVAAALPGSGTVPPPVRVIWRRLEEIPPNVVEVAKLAQDGFVHRDAEGSWTARNDPKLGERIAFSFGDATPAPIYTADVACDIVEATIYIESEFNGGGAAVSLGTEDEPGSIVPEEFVDPSSVGAYVSGNRVRLSAGESAILSITPGAGASAGAGTVIITLLRA